jgi:hypothetical protein
MWMEYLDPQISARNRWAAVPSGPERHPVDRPRPHRKGFGGRVRASGLNRRVVSGALPAVVAAAVLGGCGPTWSIQAPAPAHTQVAPTVAPAQGAPTTLPPLSSSGTGRLSAS